MLSITATNFGVNPSDIQIKEYHEQNLLVLEGDIPVDTTAAEYAGIRPMKLTVADLPFAKSRQGLPTSFRGRNRKLSGQAVRFRNPGNFMPTGWWHSAHLSRPSDWNR